MARLASAFGLLAFKRVLAFFCFQLRLTGTQMSVRISNGQYPLEYCHMTMGYIGEEVSEGGKLAYSQFAYGIAYA